MLAEAPHEPPHAEPAPSPSISAIVRPGAYLAALAFDGELADAAILRGLEMMGWSQATIDASADIDSPHADIDSPHRRHVRFAGELTRPITLRTAGRVSLRIEHSLERLPCTTLDPLASLDASFAALELVRGSVYEARFLSRLSRARASPHLRRDVESELEGMHFEPLSLVALRRNFELPDRHARVTLWIGALRWRGPDRGDPHLRTLVTSEDPLCFEELVLV